MITPKQLDTLLETLRKHEVTHFAAEGMSITLSIAKTNEEQQPRKSPDEVLQEILKKEGKQLDQFGRPRKLGT